METKYYAKYTENGKSTEWKDVELNVDNMFFVQLDASIRYAFLKFDIDLPKYIYIEYVKCGKEFTKAYINIFRPKFDMTEYKTIDKWLENKFFVLEELKHQAECKSTDYIEFNVEII